MRQINEVRKARMTKFCSIPGISCSKRKSTWYDIERAIHDPDVRTGTAGEKGERKKREMKEKENFHQWR